MPAGTMCTRREGTSKFPDGGNPATLLSVKYSGPSHNDHSVATSSKTVMLGYPRFHYIWDYTQIQTPGHSYTNNAKMQVCMPQINHYCYNISNHLDGNMTPILDQYSHRSTNNIALTSYRESPL